MTTILARVVAAIAICTIISVFVSARVANANDFSYDYVQGTFGSQSTSGVHDATGVRLSGSKDIIPHIAITGSIGKGSFNHERVATSSSTSTTSNMPTTASTSTTSNMPTSSILPNKCNAHDTGQSNGAVPAGFDECSVGGSGDDFGVNSDSGSGGVTTYNTETSSYNTTDRYETYELSLGMTLHAMLTQSTGFYANYSFVNRYIETETFRGVAVTGGLRQMVTRNIEVEGLASTNTLHYGNDHMVGVGARYYLADELSVGMLYSHGENVNSTSVNLRVSF